MRSLVALAIVLSTTAFSCQPKVDLAVLEAAETQLMVRTQAALARTCLRPRVVSTRLDGPADQDALRVWELDPELASCREALDAASDDFWNWMNGPPTPMGQEAQVVAAQCDSARAAILRAASHDDACSPYLLGRKSPPMQLLRGIRPVQGAFLLVRSDLASQRFDSAVALALGTLAIAQDLARGEDVSVVASLVSARAISRAQNAIREILLASALPATKLDHLEDALKILKANHPSPGDALSANRWVALSDDILPALRPGWQPPAGFSLGMEPRDMNESSCTDRKPASLEEAVVRIWTECFSVHDLWLSSCPPGASLTHCQIATADLPDDPSYLTSLHDWLWEQGNAAFRFNAALLHVHARKSGVCPSIAEIEQVTAPGDEPIEASFENGAVILKRPPQVVLGYTPWGNPEAISWSIPCPPI